MGEEGVVCRERKGGFHPLSLKFESRDCLVKIRNVERWEGEMVLCNVDGMSIDSFLFQVRERKKERKSY